ncbi:AraC family transcriptional regulator [Aliirhizobium terrae]|uniref:helix-turn-helix domain-containing protein n=1 Tax=Terrirhizobium terrae TaxID=2926709 RepID=UPI0025780ACE|nr:AraC family transcriptional regulator [Rhizobium sp. CC-CFT758]WJH41070.1 AraC family transcriptional regulator [Rhizobium sp. CC-CFT758]
MSATAAVVNRHVHPPEISEFRAGLLNDNISENLPGVRHPGESRVARLHLLDIAPKPSNPSATTGGLAPWQVKKVKQHIGARIAYSIPLDELAQQVRLSTSYFSTAFKVTFGISPHSYIVVCRVEHAKHRMLNTEAPLCEIALDCGLADQSHLSRVFRRVTGTTPSAWRRNASRPEAIEFLQ